MSALVPLSAEWRGLRNALLPYERGEVCLKCPGGSTGEAVSAASTRPYVVGTYV